MAVTYLVLNIAFIIAILVLFAPAFKRPSKAWWISLVALLILTAVFDSLIVFAGIVGYDSEKILGLYIFSAPIEDFFYALLAAILVPILWHRFAPSSKQKGKAHEKTQ